MSHIQSHLVNIANDGTNINPNLSLLIDGYLRKSNSTNMHIPNDVCKIIQWFASGGYCINCNIKVLLIAYFCGKCAKERLAKIDKHCNDKSQVDKYGIWGMVHKETCEESDMESWFKGHTVTKIYHLISNTLFHTEVYQWDEDIYPAGAYDHKWGKEYYRFEQKNIVVCRIWNKVDFIKDQMDLSLHKNYKNLNWNISSKRKLTSVKNACITYQKNDTDAVYSDLQKTLNCIEKHGYICIGSINKISPPSPSMVQLRSSTFKVNRKKETNNKPIMFGLIYAQLLKTTDVEIDNIAIHPASWFKQNINLKDKTCFTIIVRLKIEFLKMSFITYHILNNIESYTEHGTPITNDSSFNRVLDIILNTNDDGIRDNRIKLIPRIVDGPYPVKRVVGNRPVLLGHRVTQKYFRGPNYFVIESNVDESMVTASIIKLCHRFSSRIIVEMIWIIQGDEIEELPERILCGCTVHNMDFTRCTDIKYEMMNCPKLKYQKLT